MRLLVPAARITAMRLGEGASTELLTGYSMEEGRGMYVW